jgi:micrococcal nuclease
MHPIGINIPTMRAPVKFSRYAERRKEGETMVQGPGKRAYMFTKNLVVNKRVSLEFDVKKYDRYGCLLAYAYLKDNGLFVNAEIIKQGYASLMAISPNVKYADLFKKLYREARENRRGLWR